MDIHDCRLALVSQILRCPSCVILLILTLHSHSKCSFSTLAWAFMAMDCRQSEKKQQLYISTKDSTRLNLTCHCNMPIICFSTAICWIKVGWNSYGIISWHIQISPEIQFIMCVIFIQKWRDRNWFLSNNFLKLVSFFFLYQNSFWKGKNTSLQQ